MKYLKKAGYLIILSTFVAAIILSLPKYQDIKMYDSHGNISCGYYEQELRKQKSEDIRLERQFQEDSAKDDKYINFLNRRQK